MDHALSILFLLSSLGVINGFLLALFMLSGKKRTVSEVYFSGLLIAICIRIGKSVYLHFLADIDRLVLQMGLSAGLFVGPFFYLTLRSAIRKEQQFYKKDGQLLAGLFLLTLVVGFVYPYRTFPQYWNQYFIHVIYSVWAICLVGGLYEGMELLRKWIRNPLNRPRQENHLIGLTAGMLFISLTYFFAMYINGITYIWGALGFSLIFYVLLFQWLKNRYWKSSTSVVTGTGTDGITMMKKVDTMMEEQRLFKHPKLKLEDLATQANIGKHQLSRILNQHYPGGFPQYISQWRVREAKRLIGQKHELSLEGIGYESGFNSKSSFYATFKKVVGCTPAQFKKSLENKNSKPLE